MKTQPCNAKLRYNAFNEKKKQKNIFNEIKYDKLYPPGSTPAHIYGTAKMQKFSS